LGCWHINGSLSYRITEEGDTVFISKESENVSPQVTFLYSHKGSIKYGDGNFVCFRWQEIPENRIKITFFHDSATNRILSVQNTDDRLELWENKDSDSVNKYIMSKTDYIIEEYNGKKLKVTKEEYKYLMNNNPFKDLQCYVAVGRENGSKLQIGGQEYLEVIHQQPDTQFVVFVKSSIHQKNIPCYLITIRANGNGKTYANYIKHVKIKKINQRDMSEVNLSVVSNFLGSLQNRPLIY